MRSGRAHQRAGLSLRAWAIVLAWLLLPACCPAQALPGGRCLAVIVGVNHHADVQFAPLNYCGNDARLIGQVLETHVRIPADQIALLTEEQTDPSRHPRRENLIREVQRQAEQCRPGDTLLVFFSGHGVSDATGQVILATQDCLKKEAATTGVPVQWLKETMERCQATRKLLLLDCCHAGAARNAEQPDTAQLAPCFAHARGLVTLASCAVSELSHEWPEVRQGLFTYFVAQGLKGKADLDGDRIVDVDELYKFVYDRVSTTARKIKNVQQHPQIYRGSDVSGVFAVTQLGPTDFPQLIAEQPESRYWITAEALAWWASPAPIPVTLLESSHTPTGPAEAILFGKQNYDLGVLPGVRVAAGGWIDADRVLGAELVGFWLLERTMTYAITPLVSPYSNEVVRMPFEDAKTGRENSYHVYSPVGVGSFQAESSLALWGGEANALHQLTPQWDCPLLLVGGVRVLSVGEDLQLRSQVASTFVPSLLLYTRDQFQTDNLVVAPQVGLQWKGRYGPFTGELASKVAVGANFSTVRVQGSTDSFLSVEGQTTSRRAIGSGGVYAQVTNSTAQSQARFVWMPELSAHVHWELLEGVHLSLGYSVLYLSDVLRPGPQIDRVINADQFGLAPGSFFYPEPARPGILLRSSSFLVQGLQAGFEIRF
ncbi:MAG: BBP7 family outer membrane beta-barrel protein [Gemmataceae bacterium]